MMDKITTRIAAVNDAGLIAKLSKQSFYQAFHAQNTKEDMDIFLATNFSETATKEELANGLNTFFLAYYNDELCGYANVREGKELEEFPQANALQLARIYLLDGFSGKGIGKTLMQQCINEAKVRKKEFIWLGVWEHNHHAIKFYQQWGFEKFGEEVFMLGNDEQHDWRMRKML